MKIAWFTPFSKSSAIGVFSQNITDYLKINNKVDIWTADESNLIKTTNNIYHIGSGFSRSKKINEYDILIYNMGNYLDYHKKIYEMSIKHKGIIILHDHSLNDFLKGYYFLYKKNARAYHDLIDSVFNKKVKLSEIENYPLIEPVIKNAYGVIVHSQYSYKLIENKVASPLISLKLPVPKLPTNIKHNSTFNKKIYITTIGHVNRNKQIDKIIDVIGKNKSISNKVIYNIVGLSEDSEYAKYLVDKIKKYGLTKVVKFLGSVSSHELYRILNDSDICINLRYPNIETASLSIIEQMFFKKPVIVNDSGSYSEFPDNTVFKISLSEKSLEDSLLTLINNPKLRKSIGQNAYRYIIKNHSSKNYCYKLLPFIKEVCDLIPVLDIIDNVSIELKDFKVENNQKFINSLTEEIFNLQ